jgi:hypothetical protein
MVLRSMYCKYVVVEDQCPECGRKSITDMGGHYFPLPRTTNFWCEEHGAWNKEINWGDLVDEYNERTGQGQATALAS